MTTPKQTQKVQLLWSQYSLKCQEIFNLIQEYGLTHFEYVQVDNPKVRNFVKRKFNINGVPAIILRFSNGKYKVLKNNEMIDWLATIIGAIRSKSVNSGSEYNNNQPLPDEESQQINDEYYGEDDPYQAIDSQYDYSGSEEEISRTRRNRNPREDARKIARNREEESEEQMKSLRKGGKVKLRDNETGVQFQFGGGVPTISKSKKKQKQSTLDDKIKEFQRYRKDINGESDDDENERLEADEYYDNEEDGDEDFTEHELNDYLSDEEDVTHFQSNGNGNGDIQTKNSSVRNDKGGSSISARAAAIEEARNRQDEENKQQKPLSNRQNKKFSRSIRTLEMKE